MITSEKIFEFVEIFETILPYAEHENALNMNEPAISTVERLFVAQRHQCGTTHCHAGWFYLAKKWDRKSDYLKEDDDIDYREGIDLINSFFMCCVQDWAETNYNIWGNDYGNNIFINELAFLSDTRPEGAKNLQDIIDHWGEVGMRLQIQELYLQGADGNN